MHSELSIARALTWRYVFALTLVALLATAAWFSLHLVITEQNSIAAVVNVSGRQRMLSQRTALFASLLPNTPMVQRASVRRQLAEAADLMQRSHLGLTRGDHAMGLPATMSPAVRALYFDGPAPLDGRVRQYLAMVQTLLATRDEDLGPAHPSLQYIIAEAPGPLVTALDRMVRLYQLEGEAAIVRLQTTETIVWLLTLLLLTAEAAFIFRPFARQIRDALAKLHSATESLFESRERLRIVTENAADWLWETDATGMVTQFSSRGGHPLQAGQLLERQLVELIDDNQPQQAYAELAAAIAVCQSYRDIVLPLRTGAGPTLWVRASGAPHWSKDGEFQGYLGVWTDITAAKRLEDELRKYQDNLEELVRQRTAELQRTSAELAESEEIFRLISTSANDAILIIDLDETILYWNPAACAMLGYTAAEAVGRHMHQLLAPARYQDAIRRGFAQFRETGDGAMVGKTVELAALRKDGAELPIGLSISSMRLNGRLHALGIIRDISERVRMEQELRQMATTDFLTGLPNRRHFIACLEQLQANMQRQHTACAAVLMFDLDYFKRINDNYGHAAGDAVLRQVAALVRDQLRKTDSAGRVGGEEFAILLPESDLAGALAFAERLRQSVEQTPLPFDGREIRVTTSIGVAAMDAADACAEAALARADMALYRAKEDGRNRVCAAAPDGAHGEEKTPCLAP
ncbi:MAG TPA: hypothetical protein DHV59_08915 [Oxalobacteraceae bacterium]|nr:hypothetical protein [Oxalobacteraceae bacterium]